MNSTQYKNIIDYTVSHNDKTNVPDNLETVRTVFKNMGVPLPHGTCKEVYEILKTDDYMGWHSCTIKDARDHVNEGTPAIGISEDRIVVISPEDTEETSAVSASSVMSITTRTIETNSSVMSLSDSTQLLAVADLEYYAYSRATTGNNTGGGTNYSIIGVGSSIPVGWTGTAMVYPTTTHSMLWSSSNISVVDVGLYTGKITAVGPGIATITARSSQNTSFAITFEIWVKGKTPVFLIHGRTSNSKDVWGINNNIPSGQNNHFNSDINALSLNSKKYTDVNSQELGSFEPDNGDNDTDYPCNLGNKLLGAGYKKNVNLFAFNYPNEDAVKYSAQKFEAYINNLVSYVRTSSNNEMKACFYASRNDYNNNNYKINIVGHSMGGLVARYYIENLYHDYSVSKLVTICTPHWGSGYANLSNTTGARHVLCDHDLDFDSTMYGGSNTTTVNCNKGSCPGSNYTVTPELQYQRQRSTKYYAIAGIDYDAAYVNLNDHPFEMPTNFTTYQEITDYLVSKNVYKLTGKDLQIVYKPNPKSIGDNMVGFMSQIGWTEDISSTPNKKISMKKIFVDVDTNGGNSIDEGFVWELLYGFGTEILHNKTPHRIPVCDKVIEYLED